MNPQRRQFAAFLSKRRKQRKLTMDQLAEAVGVTKSNVHYWETGEFAPKPAVLNRLARVLDVDGGQLFALAGYPDGIPGVKPYLRAKFPHLPAAAHKEAERFFRDLESRYGGDDADRA